ncbi:Uncharacterized protein DBV15_05399 [Temnothorax longispinosus]|uniref:Uncharacterized protein n=1 Tax=Temnothorax longispinosus TaxID=300112 RepID=A0A4S2JDA9_9HYME|nr:Uncharacterized protein DBV15_05399 [Temnothorax longispinosus]
MHLNGLTRIARQLRLCSGSFVKRRCARGSNLNEVRNDEEENKKDPGWRIPAAATVTAVPHQAQIGSTPKTAASRRPAARYPPRQPLNLWRCDNVDAAFCMLDCCRIHSRFSPSSTPDGGVYSPRFLSLSCSLSLSLSRPLGDAFPNAYAGISELHHHRHRSHRHHRHCRTVVLAAAVIYYLLKLVWPGFIAYVAASETVAKVRCRARTLAKLS